MFLYPVGIPMGFLYILWPDHERICTRTYYRMPEGLEHLAPLCEQYEPHVWYWEVIECIRKYYIFLDLQSVEIGTLNQNTLFFAFYQVPFF